MFFKILVLNSDAAAALDELQQQYEIQSVEVLGWDSQDKYLLIRYANQLPDDQPQTPTSGSVQ